MFLCFYIFLFDVYLFVFCFCLICFCLLRFYAIVAKAIAGTVAADAPAPSTPQDVAPRRRDFSAMSILESPSPRLVRPRFVCVFKLFLVRITLIKSSKHYSF